MLYGRDVERGRLAGLVEDARRGRAGGLVVRGEAGVGKSALVEDVLAGAAGVRVLRTQGLESESPLAFAALHRLLRPVQGLLDRLPPPQARALRVVFGAQDGPALEPFLVAVATLSLLVEAAEDAVVCCLVDDAHWLDPASADALLFAARRLEADRVVMLFVARDGEAFPAEGLPSLGLAGLDPAAARTLLAERSGHQLSGEVSEQLLAHSAGNPLALVELPATLTAEQLQGTAPMPARLPLTDRVERAFLDRCRRLPEPVQTLLLVAAADDSGQAATVRRAAAILGADVLGEAERSGLLHVDGDRVRVRHPLVRSAVYQAATSPERHAVHRALADVAGAAGDFDREAWHRAAGVDGPDEPVAAALEGVGVRAERRGGYAAAAAAYERAAELTAARPLRAPRLFAAARAGWAAGRPARARALAAAAREGTDDPLLRADIDRLRGRIEVSVGSASDAHRIFARAAQDVAGADPDRALEMAVAASVLAVYGADSGALLGPVAIRAAGDDPRTRCLTELLDSMTSAARGDLAAAVRSLRVALAAGARVGDPDVLANLGNAALHLGDDDAHLRTFSVLQSAARADDAGTLLAYALPRLAFGHLLAGQWTAAGSAAAEALALSTSTGQRALSAAPLAWLALLAALQGKPDADARLADLDTVAGGHPLGILADPVHDLTRWARATRAANDGDSHAALHHLGRLRLPVIARMAGIDRFGAAVRAGDQEQAAVWVGELAAFADATGRAWALAAADHGRALLAGPGEAPGLFERALSHGGRPYDRARTHLAYGEFLRRNQRRVEARTHLRLALDTFQDLHAEPLVAHTARELRASGQTARTRDPSTLLTLTPMELRVAQLVSQGLSNKDVAAQCWISPRTVAFHLRNCFAKTGVTSRGELARLDLG